MPLIFRVLSAMYKYIYPVLLLPAACCYGDVCLHFRGGFLTCIQVHHLHSASPASETFCSVSLCRGVGRGRGRGWGELWGVGGGWERRGSDRHAENFPHAAAVQPHSSTASLGATRPGAEWENDHTNALHQLGSDWSLKLSHCYHLFCFSSAELGWADQRKGNTAPLLFI